MTIEDYYKDLQTYNLDFEMELRIQACRVIGVYKDQLTYFHERYPDLDLDVRYNSITLRHTGNRDIVLWFLQVFGGTWQKEVNDYQRDKMDYIQEIQHPFIPGYKFRFVVEATTPPPSCQIVEVDEVVPEHIVKRKKIVCPKAEEVNEAAFTDPTTDEVQDA